MKSYRQHYRVFYKCMKGAMIKSTGIPIDVEGWGRVMCRKSCCGMNIWSLTDFESGALIDTIQAKNSEELLKKVPWHFKWTIIPRFEASPYAQQTREQMRRNAYHQIPFIRRYVALHKFPSGTDSI